MGSGNGEVFGVSEASKVFARILAARGNAVQPVSGDHPVDPGVLALNPTHGEAWYQVKAKSAPSYLRRLARWEHGVDVALIEEYEAIERDTGAPVWLVIHEARSPSDPTLESVLVKSGAYLGIRLANALLLGERRPEWPGGTGDPRNRGRDGRGGLLWPRSAMTPLAKTGEAAFRRR